MAMVAMAASVTAVLLNSFGGRLLPRRETKEQVTVEKLVLKVPTIHCEGCLTGIRDALQKLPDIQAVDGGVKDKRITVTHRDGQMGRAEICKSLAEIGHVCGE
jgi:copper chaperone CopZ